MRRSRRYRPATESGYQSLRPQHDPRGRWRRPVRVGASPLTRTRPAVRCCSMRSCDSPAATSRSSTVGILGRSSVTGSSCIGGPTARGPLTQLVSLNSAAAGSRGLTIRSPATRRGATTPPDGKFGAPLPASSAASADPLTRPGTGPSLYATRSSLRAVARRSARWRRAYSGPAGAPLVVGHGAPPRPAVWAARGKPRPSRIRPVTQSTPPPKTDHLSPTATTELYDAPAPLWSALLRWPRAGSGRLG